MGARPQLHEGPRVAVARGLTELECIVPAWEELSRAALEPNPFYEPWMLRPALEAFGAGRDLRMVQVWAGERLAGLFPFERVARYKGLPAAALVSLQHAHTLLCTPLVRADMARPCLEALFEQLDAPLLELRYIPEGEAFHRALREVMAARGLPSVVNHACERPLLRKHGATVSGNFRRKAAQSERRMKNPVHLTLEPHHDVGRWIEDFLRIEAAGWKGRNGSAMASSEANRRYFRDIVGAAFRRGRLLGCGLDAQGRPVARRLSFTAGEAAYAFKTAYDESFAEFSPGALLELDNVRQVDADPRIQWMDSFTEGGALAVERLWPERRRVQTLVAGIGARGRLAVAALPCLRWIKRRIGEYSPLSPPAAAA